MSMFPQRKACWAAAATVLLVAGAATLAAQSLAEVARQEEERRKAIKTPSKVYTNKDVLPAPPVSATPPPASPAADAINAGDADKGAAKDGKSPSKDAAASKDASASKEAGKDVVKDQAYWSKRMKDLQTQLDRDQNFADALQSRINGLTADFSARDDPAQRAVIGQDRQKAVDELARVKKAIEDDKKAVADLQEEARRASVPPGWLR